MSASMDHHSTSSSTVVDSSNGLNHNDEGHNNLVDSRDGTLRSERGIEDVENKGTGVFQSEERRSHDPIHSNQDNHDTPLQDLTIVEPSTAEVERTVERSQIQLEPTTTPMQIHAPDGLPRVQGKHFIPRPITFYASVAIITLDLFVMPVVYYYAFLYGTSLSLQDNFAVITGLFGLFCFLHYTYRGYKLLLHKKDRKKCRPLGWTRMGIAEFLHVNIAILIFIVEVELVAGTAPNDPITRLIAMVPASIVYYCGFLSMLTQIFTDLKLRLPFNQSSTPKGSIWRPALLVFIEDFGAIECSGERDYRAAILARYDASVDFRRMIRKLSWFWGIGLILIGGLATGLIFGLHDEHVAFGIGWGVPPVLIAPLAIITNFWVNWETRRERRRWAEKYEADYIGHTHVEG